MTGAVDWVLLDADAVEIGDVLCADAGGMPALRVVAQAEGHLWLRDDEHPFDWIVPVGAFHWKVRRA